MSQPNMPGYRPPTPQYGKSQLTDDQRRRQRTFIGAAIGCLGFLFLVTCVGGFFAFKAAQGVVYTGAVDRTSMQQKIGQDVPLYPNGVVNEMMTRTMMSTTGVMGKLMTKIGGATPASVALETDDNEQAILDYYRRELSARGWKDSQAQRTVRGQQAIFLKNSQDMLQIQVQPSPQTPGKRMIVLMRMKIPMGGRNAPDPKAQPTIGDGPGRLPTTPQQYAPPSVAPAR
jgi:hypothetical protein